MLGETGNDLRGDSLEHPDENGFGREGTESLEVRMEKLAQEFDYDYEYTLCQKYADALKELVEEHGAEAVRKEAIEAAEGENFSLTMEQIWEYCMEGADIGEGDWPKP